MSSIILPKVNDVKDKIFTYIWQFIDDKYPLFEERQIDWIKLKGDYYDKVETINDYYSLYSLLNNLLLRLKDPHTRILFPLPNYTNVIIPMLIISIGNDFYISSSFSNKLLPGMKILSINHIPIAKIKADLYKKFNFNSKSAKKIFFIDEILNGNFSSELFIEAISENEVVSDTISHNDANKILENGDINSTQFTFCNYRIIDNNIDYLNILSFKNKKVINDFNNILANTKNDNPLIIDIRYNQGGSIDAAINIASMFVDENIIIGYKQNRKENGNHSEFNSPIKIEIMGNKHIKLDRNKLVILCNEFTASSAEFIFLKALKYSNKNISIIGNKTAGLAHGATVYTLFDKTKLQLTTWRYLDLYGNIINEEGIAPDIQIDTNANDFFTKGIDHQLDYALNLVHRHVSL